MSEKPRLYALTTRDDPEGGQSLMIELRCGGYLTAYNYLRQPEEFYAPPSGQSYPLLNLATGTAEDHMAAVLKHHGLPPVGARRNWYGAPATLIGYDLREGDIWGVFRLDRPALSNSDGWVWSLVEHFPAALEIIEEAESDGRTEAD